MNVSVALNRGCRPEAGWEFAGAAVLTTEASATKAVARKFDFVSYDWFS